MICFWPLARRQCRLISRAAGPEKPKCVKRKLPLQEKCRLPSATSVKRTSRVIPDNDFKSLELSSEINLEEETDEMYEKRVEKKRQEIINLEVQKKRNELQKELSEYKKYLDLKNKFESKA